MKKVLEENTWLRKTIVWFAEMVMCGNMFYSTIYLWKNSSLCVGKSFEENTCLQKDNYWHCLQQMVSRNIFQSGNYSQKKFMLKSWCSEKSFWTGYLFAVKNNWILFAEKVHWNIFYSTFYLQKKFIIEKFVCEKKSFEANTCLRKTIIYMHYLRKG